MIRAVVFDLDGVLIDSEQIWDQARRDVAERHAGRWRDDATTVMQGMSSLEWSRYMNDALGVDVGAEAIADLVVKDVLERYDHGLPIVAGATAAVRRMSESWPLGLASSANRVVIDAVLDIAGIRPLFRATVSSEEVPRGKPHPDVYQEVARRLQRSPSACAAVEDSANGIRSALAAGMRVVAIPNPHYPPPDDVLDHAHLVVPDLDGLSVDLIDQLDDGNA